MASNNRIRRPSWNNSAENAQTAAPSPHEALNNSYRASQPGASMPPQTNGGRHLGQSTIPANSASPAPNPPRNQQAPQQAAISGQQNRRDNLDPKSRNSDDSRNGGASDSSNEYISQKIYKINGKDKVIDFTSKLVKAKLNDFANVHGCGGKDHAPNSTIGVVICDYTKGTGDNSVTMRFNMDVEDMTLLYHVSNGIFAGTSYGSPVLPYVSEKNNPYAKGSDGYVPVSRIEINYQPTRQNGQKSNYPWYISITNYEAPLSESANGATAHVGSQARNKRSAYINVSALDFGRAMVAVDRFLRLWEHRMLPVMDEAYQRIDAARQENQTNCGH